MIARTLSGFLTKSFAGRNTFSTFKLYIDNPRSHCNVNLVQPFKPLQRNFNHLVSEMSKKAPTSKQAKQQFQTQPVKNMSSQNDGLGGGSKKESHKKPAEHTDGKTQQHLQNEENAELKSAREAALSMPIDEKRKRYKCRDRYVMLSNIPSWKSQPKLDESSATLPKKKKSSPFKAKGSKKEYEIRPDLNEKVSLWIGDITSLEIDAIVNAANEKLQGGGGVDGAIHSAAGPNLKKECKKYNGCNTGEAKTTAGYDLPAKYVIHTVGPIGESPKVLESCYVESLQRMKEEKLKTIAFPCIATGIYGYPNEKAVKVALKTVREFLEDDPYGPEVERVIFCLFMKVDVTLYKEEMNNFFPLGDSKAEGEGESGDGAKASDDGEATATTVDEAIVSDDSRESKNESMEVDDPGDLDKEKGDNSKVPKGSENDIEMKDDQSENQNDSVDDKGDDNTQRKAEGKEGSGESAEIKGDESSQEKKSVSTKKESAEKVVNSTSGKSASDGSEEPASVSKIESSHL
ncbi:ADP-ribose glycohydrolase MACROD2-like isoform X1 [Haliotis asinina]|uniref:ADP-ribose glycohydrolase MACROD2-like isoform X1 n=1 Tax=Haliotis asinina TaxID=109174 RepID=UPI003531A5D4